MFLDIVHQVRESFKTGQKCAYGPPTFDCNHLSRNILVLTLRPKTCLVDQS